MFCQLVIKYFFLFFCLEGSRCKNPIRKSSFCYYSFYFAFLFAFCQCAWTHELCSSNIPILSYFNRLFLIIYETFRDHTTFLLCRLTGSGKIVFIFTMFGQSRIVLLYFLFNSTRSSIFCFYHKEHQTYSSISIYL